MGEKQEFEIQDKRITCDNLIYIIFEEKSSAGITGWEGNLDTINIPSSITHKSKEYYVTKILPNAFKNSEIKNVQFSSDSKLETIEKESFSCSTIKSIKIPSTVTLIGEKAFFSCNQLENIEIPSESKLQIIEEYAFSYSSIKSIKIPKAITSICEGAFYSCILLKQIEIPSESKLQTIEKYSFSYTGIEKIKIPSSVTIIGEESFYSCRNLQQFEIPNDSKLQTIDTDALTLSEIDKFTIPSELVELKEGWCSCLFKLTKIEVNSKNPRYCCYDNNKMIIGKSNIDQNNYDCLLFCVRDIHHIKIPNFIKNICQYSFNNCFKIQDIEFENNSKCQIIDKYAFSNSNLKRISIPSSVTFFGINSFSNCFEFERIDIQNDSLLQKIDQYAFLLSKIKCISIPSSVTSIKSHAFSACTELLIIEIKNEELKSMCQEAFDSCQDSLLIMVSVHS